MMCSMRVLHVYRTFFPDTQGGLEEVIRQICAGTHAYGADCTVLTTTKNSATLNVVKVDDITVIRVPETFEVASCNVALGAFKEFKKLVAAADLIHYHFPWPFADLLAACTPQSKPSIITYHSDIIRQKFLLRLYTPLMEKFLKLTDRIVCTSPNYFVTSRALTKFEHKVDVIPIGIDPATYPVANDESIREAESTFGRGFFLFVGVLRYYKGLDILLRAIENASFKVVIVGSGPTERHLKAEAKRLRLDNVVFAGYVSDTLRAALFQLSLAIVFPSYLRSEAFGVTLLEGAMYAKPLISTEVGSGTSHVNIHNQTGLVIAPGSPRALRKAMEQIHRRPELAESMGLRAKQRFHKLFTGQLMAERYWTLYQDVLDQRLSQESAQTAKTQSEIA